MNSTAIVYAEPAFHLNFTQSESSNRTTVPATKSGNKLLLVPPSLNIVCVFATLYFNGLILVSFIKRPNLRTPFNSYVINIVVIDIVTSLITMLLVIVVQMVGQWPFNGLFCSIVLYLSQLCNAGNRAAHLLVAANRLWAVTYPLSYRYRHIKRLAVGVVLFAWSLTICIVTPRVIIARRNVNYSMAAVDPSCAFETDSYAAFHKAFNVVVFNMPEVIILIAYPWLLFKLRQRYPNKASNRSVKAVAPDTLGSTASAALSSKAHARPMNSEDMSDLENPQETQETAGVGQSSRSGPSEPVISAQQPHAAGQTRLSRSEDAQWRLVKWFSRSKCHNRLFAYLVLSVACCWTPNHVFFLWSGNTGRWNVPFYYIQSFLSYANSWMNPILIYLADSQIRSAVKDLMKCS